MTPTFESWSALPAELKIMCLEWYWRSLDSHHVDEAVHKTNTNRLLIPLVQTGNREFTDTAVETYYQTMDFILITNKSNCGFCLKYPVQSQWVRHIKITIHAEFGTKPGQTDILEHLLLDPESGFGFLLHSTQELSISKHPFTGRFLKANPLYRKPDNEQHTLWQRKFPNLETLDVRVVLARHTGNDMDPHPRAGSRSTWWEPHRVCFGEHNVTTLKALLEHKAILIMARKNVDIDVCMVHCRARTFLNALPINTRANEHHSPPSLCSCEKEIKQALQGLVKKWKLAEESE
jgi:hypothetical protein